MKTEFSAPVSDEEVIIACKASGFYVTNESMKDVRKILEDFLAGRKPVCQHRIVDARNEHVSSGFMCVDCGALFAAAIEQPRYMGIVTGEERGYCSWGHVVNWENQHLPVGTKFYAVEPKRG